MIPVIPSTATDALKTGLMPLLEQKQQQQLPINTKSHEQKPQFQEVHTSCILDSDEINKQINESQLNPNSQDSNSQHSNTNHSLNSLTSHRTIIPPPVTEKPEKTCKKVSLNCNCTNSSSSSSTNQTTSNSVSSAGHNPLTTHTTGGAEPCEDLDPDKHSLLTRSVAGGIAGLVEHLAIYPFDTIKTNTQTGLRGQIQIHTNLDYLKWYTTRQAWSGVNALIPACTVAHALQFPCIEFTEQYLENKHPAINSSFAAGVIGILPHDLVMNPANVVKQRMQMVNNTEGKSSTMVAKELYRQQGMKVFYRSLPAQYSVGAIFMGTFYYSYNDNLKNSLNKQAEKYGLEKHWFPIWMIRNTMATAIAVAITQPIDTIVTRVNTGYGENGKTTIRSTIKNMTLRSSFKGIGARMSCSIPASILTWGTYEAIKYMLVEEKGKLK